MATPLPTPSSFSVKDAWKPLPKGAWNEVHAAHLLRRIGFAATPELVQSALQTNVETTISKAFRDAEPLVKSKALSEFAATANENYRAIYRDLKTQEEKRDRRNELRKEDNKLFREYGMSWFRHARKQRNSATEKLVLFLQDVFVVDRRTIQDTPSLFNMQQILREGLGMKYDDLCKWVSREPAMIRYLDLDKNTARKPNENFARELFELFTLGEGNYTETDIKEAARAFTGYRARNRYEFYFQRKLHDTDRKTVFNETGNWDGDDIIDITFRQPAAKTYLIKELFKFYLTEETVHREYVEELGNMWANHDFELSYLVNTFFGSQLFYHPAFQGNLVKSPVHFYLGLCQDLRLDVVPFESRLLRSMDVMGQSFYNPPNVQGWLYGEYWINSTTISARRQLVDYLFTALNEEKLNGNDQKSLKIARNEGRGDFLVTQDRLTQLTSLEPSEIATHLTKYLITAPSRPTYKPVLQNLLRSSDSLDNSIRYAIIALLQSPAYNLC
ncbi:MAG: DUF1800 family protein [Verrucomicrobiota bacterium]